MHESEDGRLGSGDGQLVAVLCVIATMLIAMKQRSFLMSLNAVNEFTRQSLYRNVSFSV